jgi:hypothetical protein
VIEPDLGNWLPLSVDPRHDVVPAQGPDLLGAQASEQGNDDVRLQPRALGGTNEGSRLL